MTTPYDIITRAMKDIGALASGENPTADEAQDGLDMLNDMIAQWSNENMMVFYCTEIVFPCVQNQIQYTLGPGGNVSARFVGSISGSPEGFVAAKVGSLVTRTNGGANTTLYVKESGSGNTGWVAK